MIEIWLIAWRLGVLASPRACSCRRVPSHFLSRGDRPS